MFKFLRKEESKKTPEIIQSEDWTKDIKRSKKIGQEVEQLTFMYDSEGPIDTKGTKQGPSNNFKKM